MTELIGQRLGPYNIIEQIGVGGMATVYKAYQASVDRYVAVKVLPRRLAQDSSFIGRFEQEARTIAKLEHPHILPLYDYGEQEGITYLVMRFIGTGTLRESLAERGPLSLDETVRIMGQVGGALGYAHSQGVIHRDIKPSNVLVDPRGDCFLTDFGIARLVEGTTEFTATGRIVGTPAYMAPEQGMGEKADARSDLYALGIILYEMVAGKVPYEAETPLAVLMKHATAPLPSPREIRPDLPEGVEQVILKALSKPPDERFQRAEDMVSVLPGAIRSPAVVATEAAAPPISGEATAVMNQAPMTEVVPKTVPGRVFFPGLLARSGMGWLPVIVGGAVTLIALAVAAILLLPRVVFDPQPSPSPSIPAESPTVAAVQTEETNVPATSTPTLEIPIRASAELLREANVHEGPSEAYASFATIGEGKVVEVIGRNKKGTWWQIIHPSGPRGRGWIDADDAEMEVDASALSVVSVPSPTATATPTVTPTSTNTPSPTLTSTSTNTPSPTLTSTSTNTPLPTLTPTRTPTRVQLQPISAPTPVFVRDTDGYQALTRHFVGRPVESESFSPVGDEIAITEGIKLYTIRRDGSSLKVWMEEDETIRPIGGVVWSPDGQYIAFMADRKQNCNLCRVVGVIRLSDGLLHYLEATAGQVTDLPRWTEDGRLLVTVHSGDSANGTTYIYDRAGAGGIASGSYNLSSSHDGQKWFPWQPGRTWRVGEGLPDSYYHD